MWTSSATVVVQDHIRAELITTFVHTGVARGRWLEVERDGDREVERDSARKVNYFGGRRGSREAN